jgi:hypothetical protein
MYSIFKTISFSLLVFFGGDVNAENFKPTSNIWYFKSELSQNNSEFILLGTRHMIGQRDDPQIKDIQNIVEFFKPDAVVLEGGIWKLRDTIEESIDCCGEMGVSTFLAEKSGAKRYTWDSSSKEELEYLLAKYDKETIELYYFLRELKPSKKRYSQASNQEVIDRAFNRSQKDYSLSPYPNTIAEMKFLLKEKYDSEASLTDFFSFDKKIREPKLSKLQDVKVDLNHFRDSNGLLKLLNISNNHKRVLILVGKSHFRPFMNGLMPLTK